MPIKLSSVQSDPGAAQFIHKFLKETKNSMNAFMAASFANTAKRMAETQKAQEKKANDKVKKQGSITLSNTDSVSRCTRVRAALHAKLSEIYASGADDKIKDALARDILMQLQKVDAKIIEIQRREKALAEEKKVKRKESEFEKRRRKYDKEKRATTIKRAYLYPADEGGLDPNDYMPSMPGSGGLPGGDIGVITNIGSGEVSLGDADVSASVDAGGGSVSAGSVGVSVSGVSSGGDVSFEASV